MSRKLLLFGFEELPTILAAAAAAALGCCLPLGEVLRLGDAMNGLMALPNLAALFLLRREVAVEK